MRFFRKQNKYGNKKTVIDGIKFDSKKEGERFLQLKKLLDAGIIGDITVHPEFLLQEKFTDSSGKKHREIKYEADFKYFDKKIGKIIVEDVKGMRTQIYKLKKKLFLKIMPKYMIFVEK